MTNLAKIFAGGRIAADDVRNVAPLSAYKNLDEPVTTSTVLQNDDALLLALDANTTYFFVCFLDYEGGTNGSSDLKFQWNAPAGAVARYQVFAGSNSGIGTPSGIGARVQGAAYPIGTNGTGSLCAATMWGTVTTGGTPGSMQLQWAQQTSSGTSTIVHAGSALLAWDLT